MSVTTRTITVRVDGDATKANKAMSSVGKSAGGLGSKIAKIGGIIAAAFSVQKIIQFGKESVRAMMEDQKSAAILARTLKNVTKARKDDIAAVEKFIDTTELATGIADDDLRPAFARLVRSTKDITKAQKLMNVALDMTAATGKPLSAVVNALGRAADGSFGGLTRMGVSIDKATMKSKDFSKVLPTLEKMFSGSMAKYSETFAGRMARLSVAFGRIKESVGYALLGPLEKLAGWMAGKGMASIKAFMDALFGTDQKSTQDITRQSAIARAARAEGLTIPRTLEDSAKNFGKAMRDLAEMMGTVFAAFGDGTSPESGMVKFVDLLAQSVELMSTLMLQSQQFAQVFTKIDDSAESGSIAGRFQRFALRLVYGKGVFNFMSDWGRTKMPGVRGNAIGGTAMGGRPVLVGERGPEIFTPSASGYVTANNRLGMGGGGGVNVTVNVQGSVIRERDLAVSVRDEIAQLMRRRGLNPAILGV